MCISIVELLYRLLKNKLFNHLLKQPNQLNHLLDLHHLVLKLPLPLLSLWGNPPLPLILYMDIKPDPGILDVLLWTFTMLYYGPLLAIFEF